MGLETVKVQIDINLTIDEMPMNGPLLTKCIASAIEMYRQMEHKDDLRALVELEDLRFEDGKDVVSYMPTTIEEQREYQGFIDTVIASLNIK